MTSKILTATVLAVLAVAAALLALVPVGCNVDRPVQPTENGSYADIAFRLQRTDPSNSSLLDSLLALPSEEQLRILKEGAKLLGVPDTVTEAAITESEANSSMAERSEAPVAAAWGPCKQNVERDDGALVARTFAYTYGGDIWCDGDPDLDYLFYFAPRWAINPDSWRWSATDNWVKYVFAVVYRNKLLACTLCSSPVRIVLGTNGVDVAGGPGRVLSSLYIVTR